MSYHIDRNSTLPLYSQIKQILIEELGDHEKVSDLVLTEAGLMKRFRVSRAPIRQALKALEDEGYVVRHRAKGTFPIRKVNVSIPPALELGGIMSYLFRQGLKPVSRVVALAREVPEEEIALTLDVSSSTKLLHVKRIIFVKDSPLAYVSTYVLTPRSFMPEHEELEDVGSIFDLIDRDLGIRFSKGEQEIWAAGANKEEAEALDLVEGSPVMVTVTKLYTSDGKLGGWRKAVHRGEDFKYVFGIDS